MGRMRPMGRMGPMSRSQAARPGRPRGVAPTHPANGPYTYARLLHSGKPRAKQGDAPKWAGKQWVGAENGGNSRIAKQGRRHDGSSNSESCQKLAGGRSDAETPGLREKPKHPGWGARAESCLLRPPPGSVWMPTVIRGYRCAQPPATVWQASGLALANFGL